MEIREDALKIKILDQNNKRTSNPYSSMKYEQLDKFLNGLI